MGTETALCAEALTRVRLNLLSELSEKYWRQGGQLALLRLPTLRAKLSRLLLDARREQGSDTVLLSGTRETLASELGVNRSALSRELGRMQREGLLEARRRRITLLDLAGLQKNAGE
jgi:CRP-like cAMP-binding protein